MRSSIGLIALVLCLFGLAAAGQEPGPAKGTIFSSDLVAWTQMQAPQPAQQQQQTKAQVTPPVQPQHSESQPQKFAGTIQKDGESYVLRTSDKWFYDLDDQDKAEPYENQKVGVVGTLNPAGDLIHVQEIQPAK